MADEFDDLPGVDDPDEFLTAVDAMLQHLQEKAVVTAEEFYALEAQARQRAFTVSGVADLDVIADAWQAIDAAVRDGETLEDFRERVGQKLADAWGGEEPSHLETVFRTNIQTAYSAGRQVQNASVRETHPYIRYDVVDDDRTSDICAGLLGPDGEPTVVLADSDFAATHQPPLHHNCRTDAVAITEDEARELGVDTDEDLRDAPTADEGFGDPLADFEPDLSTRPAELVHIYEMKGLSEEEEAA